MSKAFKCPGCNTTTWGDLNYCPKCGCPLNIECQKCGYTNRYIHAEGIKFCPDCGELMSRDINRSSPKEEKSTNKKGEVKWDINRSSNKKGEVK